ncbi:30S ribosome-binding factor RbfA [Corynebacterium uberis]|uniref:30S ribosome-binding factor RbfA n=1 Tax=Corynebacterium TaxID=1716 RepID=UPI001D09EF07|nr:MULTISPECIES: 30S ribosome-binding factor RbfA [Corynebacterium]MCZ9308452.1 30S ribosome-binding factor RbfA [Corynebacterium sp. c6VSa_13]UDL74117.1 30S ribosome-binding factor RbfA [Corynebacterium uberis]UDL74999.1 30S ribosome-binding factor RbfA [Corynebacterium uberis]UDL77214.1 30S ribosome-binding factor RbfA [Corynebacterium uberis]UDL79496.1 30S ribosome-binding factor RbfA [Corynebacterium uberis]
MVDHARAGRMAKRIQTIVATALERQVKDPRVELITVTDCRVTGDLHDATVFYTVRGRQIGEEPDLDAAEQALGRARGQLRKLVGDELGVRFTPTLSFELDTVPETSAKMEEVLARARARDAELAKLKEQATPAGEANPYKDSVVEES